ncbi:MAG: virulence RhuM family protein, partial [Bacilli bacterium]|nr:virulence RhuM family protein [Bacilli bacterium]
MNKTSNYDIVKFIDGEFELEVSVSPEGNTVWLTQRQMASLLMVSVDNISLHIKNILKEKELDNSVIEESSITSIDGKKYKTKLYNLDMIISVGYRVKSKRGIMFRQWANKILKEYLLKGYVINENRVIVSNDNYIELKNQ